MHHGLRVHLDPRGGNQLNIREALRLLNPPNSPTPSRGAGSDGAESDSSDAAAPYEPAEARRGAINDYDYDDDFIDDGEVVEDDEVPPTPSPPPSPRPADPDDDDTDAPPPPPPRRVVDHTFGLFFANRGELPSRAVIDAANGPLRPSSKLGNVVVDYPTRYGSAPAKRPPTQPVESEIQKKPSVVQGQPSVTSAASTEPAIVTTTANPPPSFVPTAPSNASDPPTAPPPSKMPLHPTPPPPRPTTAPPATTVSAPEAVTSASSSAPTSAGSAKTGQRMPSTNGSGFSGQTGKTGRGAQAQVKVEITKLHTLCQSEFGDKKPKLSDPHVQEQLGRVFQAAMDAGVARLYSDITKDRRVVSLHDDVWQELSRFLRTKRAYLEALGHALWWGAREKETIAGVEAAEAALATELAKRKQNAPNPVIRGVDWCNELDLLVFEWYRAKTELLDARNQLSSRFKSVKKALVTWAPTLKKQVFTGWNVAESEIMDSYKRVEEVRNAAEKRDKAERKRKREEEVTRAAAAAAAATEAAAAAMIKQGTEPAHVSGVVDESARLPITAGHPKPPPATPLPVKPPPTHPPTAKAPPARPPPARPPVAKTLPAKPPPARPPSSKTGVARAPAAKPPPARTPPSKPPPARPPAAKPPPARPPAAKPPPARPPAAKPPPARPPGPKPPPARPPGSKPPPAPPAPKPPPARPPGTAGTSRPPATKPAPTRPAVAKPPPAHPSTMSTVGGAAAGSATKRAASGMPSGGGGSPAVKRAAVDKGGTPTAVPKHAGTAPGESGTSMGSSKARAKMRPPVKSLSAAKVGATGKPIRPVTVGGKPAKMMAKSGTLAKPGKKVATGRPAPAQAGVQARATTQVGGSGAEQRAEEGNGTRRSGGSEVIEID